MHSHRSWLFKLQTSQEKEGRRISRNEGRQKLSCEPKCICSRASFWMSSCRSDCLTNWRSNCCRQQIIPWLLLFLSLSSTLLSKCVVQKSSHLTYAMNHAESLRQARDSKAESDALMSTMQSELAQKTASVARLERKNNLLIKEKDGLLKMISSYEADNEPSGQNQISM